MKAFVLLLAGHATARPQESLLATAPYIAVSGVDYVRTGFCTDAQLDALRSASAGELWLRTVVELGTVYGWRRGELLGLTVQQCDFKAAIIRLEVGTTKNKEGGKVHDARRGRLAGVVLHRKEAHGPRADP